MARPGSIRLAASLREEILGAIVGAVEGVREEPWPAASHTKALQEAVPYDRRRAARAIVRVGDVRLSPKVRDAFVACADALAKHLPASLEDIDGRDVFEWLDRELSITWVDDSLALPAAMQETLTTLIESALRDAEPGEMPQKVGGALAGAVGSLVEAALGRTAASEVAAAERFLVGFLIAWLWKREGDERAIAEFATTGLAKALRVRWVLPPRPPRAYSARESFEVGDVVLHPKFGPGTVTTKGDTFVEVSFAEGGRKLAVSRARSV